MTTPTVTYPSLPPRLEALIAALDAHSIDYVLTGSVACIAYGVDTVPGDLDITPAMNEENLLRLSELLVEIEATPRDLGHWSETLEGEKHWVTTEATPEQLASWRPALLEPETFDHLFYTRFGNFDVVPHLAGDYALLMQRAQRVEFMGFHVWVAHIDELLAKLTVPRRAKDASRVSGLRQIQHKKGQRIAL